MAKRKSKERRQAMMAKVREHRASKNESNVDSHSNAPRLASPQGSLQVKANSPPRAVLLACISAPPSVPSPPCVAEETNLADLPPRTCAKHAPSSPCDAASCSRNIIAKDAHLHLSIPLLANKQYNNTTNKNIYHIPNSEREFTGKRCDYRRYVQGNFHQAYEEIFETNAGKQCTPMSLMAITYSTVKSVSEWRSNDLDQILIEGDKLYSILQNTNTIDHDFISVDELPKKYDVFGMNFGYHYQENISVVLNASNDDLIQFDSYTLLEALTVALDSAAACFVTFQNYTFVIAKNRRSYFVFDSHARDVNGCQDENGSSVMVEIDSLGEANSYCYRLLKSLRGKQIITACQVTGVNITVDKNVQEIDAAKPNEVSDLLVVQETSSKNFKFDPLDETMQKKLCEKLGITIIKYLHLRPYETLQLSICTQSIQADGNCFFRAISFALSGSEQFHSVIRNKIVCHIASKPHHFQSILRSGYKDVTEYLQISSMSKSGIWATELEIIAAADYLNTDIYTLSNSSWLKNSAKQIDSSTETYNSSIYLKHCNNNHYDVVIGMVPSVQLTTNEARYLKFNNKTQLCTELLVSQKESKNPTNSIHTKSQTKKKEPKKRKRQPYFKRREKDRNNKRLKRMSTRDADSRALEKSDQPTVPPKRNPEILASNVSLYKRNETYRNRMKDAKRLKYSRDEKLRKAKTQASLEKYKTNEAYREKLIESSKTKYRTNDVYRAEVIRSGKKKYRTNAVYKADLIRLGKKKYRTNDVYKANLIRSGKKKYRTNDVYKADLIIYGKNKYRTNDIYRKHLMKSSKRKYRTNEVFKLQLLESIKNKYRTNEVYRKQLITSIKNKYRTNEDYKSQMKTKNQHKYSSDENYRAQKIEGSKQKYFEIKNRCQTESRNDAIEFGQNYTMNKIIREFKKEITKGPEYVCCSCHRLLFENQVLVCNEDNYKKKGDNIMAVADKSISKQFVHICINSCDEECSFMKSPIAKLWICHACQGKIMNGCVPAESAANNLKCESVPQCLQSLNHLEQHLIAMHIPFMKILALPKGGQKGVNGPVVCVPSNIEQTTNILPRSDGNDMLVQVKLKRKLSYKGYYKYETINQKHLENALSYLIKNNHWYSDVSINDNWSNPLPEESVNLNDCEDANDLHTTVLGVEGEIDRNDELEERSNGLQLDSCLQPNDIGQHVLDQYFDEIMNLAPSERNNPIDILRENGNEAKTFPVHFPSGVGTYSDERDIRITLSRYFNNRLMNADNRFARDTNYIFYSQYMSELQHVISSVSIACRKSTAKTTDGTKISAEMLKDGCTLQELFKSDQIYKFLTPIRGTPPYWQTAQKDLFAMIRQLGIPTWFCSFSSADMRWKEIINTILIQQNNTRRMENLDWNEKCDILRSNPVTVARMFDHRFHKFLKNVILSDAAPIGNVKDYFYRIEFQKRGSPHAHSLFWVDNAPQFDIDDDRKITSFVNKYVTCKVPDETQDSELNEIVTSVQQHSKNHSKTCKKRGTKCRFNFPRAPSNRTFVSRSISHDGQDENLVNQAKKDIQKVWQIILEGELENLTCTQLFQKAEISQSRFEEAFGIISKRNDIVLKREVNEIWTNQYNETLLKCWNANMDIQFVLDAYACIVYVISYISKAEREMGLLLRQTKHEAEEANLDAQKTMRKLGSAYLNYREISAQEAVYRVCNLRLKECSRKVQFIPVGENPVRMRVPLRSLSSENENIWMSSINDKYQARPAFEDFETMCLAAFCSEYRILAKSQVPKNMRNNEQHDESGNIQKLKNNMGYIRKRTRTDPAVVRYARFSETKAPEMYFQSILELFLPHRLKAQLKPQEFERYEAFYQTGFVKLTPTRPLESVKSIVDSNKNKFDINGAIIDDAQQKMQTIDLEDAWARLCPETELERDECRNGAETTVQDDEVNDDINLDFADGNHIASHRDWNKNLFTKREVYPLLCSMNNKQTSVFYKVRQWCLDIIHGKNPKPIHLFITGGAGTGKSHLIKCIYYEATRLFTQIASNPDETTVLLTAPTGTAAFNIKGRTYHSALSIPIKITDEYVPLGEEKLNTLRAKLGNLQIIIIDEVSLMNKRQFYWISERLKQIKKSKENCHFGNISVITVGDFYQLPPVGMPVKYSLYKQNLSDPVNLWHDYFSVIELDQVMRQKDDLAFANMLNRCRVKSKNDKIESEDLNMLKQCCGRNTDDALHICPRNSDVNNYNKEMLLKTCINITSFEAEDFRKDKRNGQLVKRTTPYDEKIIKSNLPSSLNVAENARVMLVRNIDVEDGLVNGVIGTVCKIRPNQIFVVFDNDRVGKKACTQQQLEDVPANAISISPIEEHIDYENGVVRKQFPLRLSWACTVHKVQGLTLDKIVVSLENIFASGQAYVAFSRVKTQSGLYITNDYDETLLQKATYCEKGISDAIENMPKFITSYEDVSLAHTTIILHNIQGLISNLPCMRGDNRYLNADYLCLTETWLTGDTIENETEKLDNFSFHNKSRCMSYSSSNASFESLKEQSHGGVGVFAKKNLQFHSKNLSLPNLEYYSFAICDERMLVIVLYRPNTYPLNLFLNTLKTLVEKCSSYPTSIIMGDFNQDVLTSSTVQHFMENYGYNQLVREITTQGGTLLDHVYVKGTTNIDVKVIPTYYSYHEAILVKIPQ